MESAEESTRGMKRPASAPTELSRGNAMAENGGGEGSANKRARVELDGGERVESKEVTAANEEDAVEEMEEEMEEEEGRGDGAASGEGGGGGGGSSGGGGGGGEGGGGVDDDGEGVEVDGEGEVHPRDDSLTDMTCCSMS